MVDLGDQLLLWSLWQGSSGKFLLVLTQLVLMNVRAQEKDLFSCPSNLP